MDFISPSNLEELFRAKAEHPDYKVMAGGTDLVVQINSGILKPQGIINIFGMKDLSDISENGDLITIGSAVTHAEIYENKFIKKHLPSLAMACKSIGARQIQNRGTIGGNVMNASPAGDTLPVLLAYRSKVVIGNIRGKREINFSEFYLDYRKTALKEDEILISIKIPKQLPDEKSVFVKIGTRKTQAISKVMGCFVVKMPGKNIERAAIAYGSIASVPVRLNALEEFLTGKVLNNGLIDESVRIVLSTIKPIDDIRSTGNYRKHVCSIILKRFLSTLL